MSASDPAPAEGGGSRKAGNLTMELRHAVLQLARRIRQERSDEEITLSEFAVLSSLCRGALTPRQLADREQIQPPSMTRTVARLVAKGYATRTEHPTDRRQVLIELTPAGEGIVRETKRRRDAWLSRQLAKLEPEQRAVLAEAARIIGIMNTPQ